jgi:hypothetical protein
MQEKFETEFFWLARMVSEIFDDQRAVFIGRIGDAISHLDGSAPSQFWQQETAYSSGATR